MGQGWVFEEDQLVIMTNQVVLFFFSFYVPSLLPFFLFCFETGLHIIQAGLELLTLLLPAPI